MKLTGRRTNVGEVGGNTVDVRGIPAMLDLGTNCEGESMMYL